MDLSQDEESLEEFRHEPEGFKFHLFLRCLGNGLLMLLALCFVCLVLKIIVTQTLNLTHGQTTQERLSPEDQSFPQLSPRDHDPTFKYSSLEVPGLMLQPQKSSTL